METPHQFPDVAGRIVYIEDDEASVSLLEAILGTLYPRVQLIHAGVGAAGIQAVREHGPDLVLVDLWLPDMSGADVVRELNPEISRNALKVVMLTAAAASPDAIKALALGAMACWSKPFQLTEFRASLERLLSEGAQWSAYPLRWEGVRLK